MCAVSPQPDQAAAAASLHALTAGWLVTHGRRLTEGSRGVLLVLLLYLGSYARTAWFGFVWDDPANVSSSALLRGPLAGTIWKGEAARVHPAYERLPKDLVPAHESFRPVSVTSHWIDVHLFGDRPGLMHVHSVALGLLSILLVHAVGRRLGQGLWLTALWALHPLHVEVFAYVSARSDLLAGIFSLSALLVAIECLRANRAPVRLALAVAAGSLSLISFFAKEANLALPVAFFLLAWAIGHRRTTVLPTLALLAAGGIYFPLRRLLMESTALPMAQWKPMLRALADSPGVALAYFSSVLFPGSLSIDRPLWRPFVPLGYVAVAVLLVAALFLRRARRPSARSKLALAIAASCGGGTLLVPAALGTKSIGALADRYAFFAFLFLSVALVALIRLVSGLCSSRLLTLGKTSLAAWAVLVFLVTTAQIGVWRSDESLAQNSVASEPSSSMAVYRLATLATSQGRDADALPLLERALQLDPNNRRALNNLAVVYLHLGRVKDAKLVLKHLWPLVGDTDWKFWYNLASVQLADGERGKACAAIERALAIDPGYELALQFRAGVCQAAVPAPSAAPPASSGPSPRP
jgi:hypothetical protein